MLCFSAFFCDCPIAAPKGPYVAFWTIPSGYASPSERDRHNLSVDQAMDASINRKCADRQADALVRRTPRVLVVYRAEAEASPAGSGLAVLTLCRA